MVESSFCGRSSWPGLSARWVLIVLAGLVLGGSSDADQVVRSKGVGAADVSRVFGSWEEWAEAYDEFVSSIDDFEGLTDGPIESAEELAVVMKARDRVYRNARLVEDYIYLRLQLNGADEEARSREHLLDESDRQWMTTGSPWFTRAVTELGSETIRDWTESEETLQPYDFFFQRFFDGAAHPYAEGHEDLRKLAGIFGQQSLRIYNALAVSEVPQVVVTLESGEQLEITPARARTILWELSNPLDREAATRAWLEALGRQSQTYAALLEGVVGRQELTAEVRNFDSALSAKLHADAIPADTIRSVIRRAREGNAPMRRYHSLRREILGLEAYGLADRFVPLDESEARIEFDEARRLIIESASVLGSEVQSLVSRAFAEGWIDSVERPGKRAHGGATFVAGHPFVLVSYRGSFDSLFQLSHEIGHAVHSFIAYSEQPFVYTHPSTLTAETVAGVFESAFVEHMVGRATDRQERVRVLDLSIQSVLRPFFRPMLDADFELRVYEMIGAITGRSLGDLYLDVVADFYGDTVSSRDWDRHAWQQTPHFYTAPLYMGRYGLSSAAANALVAQLTSPDNSTAEKAQQSLLSLMQAGSSGYPLDLLNDAGVDLAVAETTDSLILRLDALVDKLERTLLQGLPGEQDERDGKEQIDGAAKGPADHEEEQPGG